MPIDSSPCSLEELREVAATGRLYAVLDACDTPAVPAKAEELGAEHAASLYSGTAQEEYWAIAPYLFRVDPELLEWIRETLWEEPWGIFAVADAEFETLRRHFKKFLVVKAPNGEQWYFRFYDPRVLESFLPTCDEEQLAEMFGPLRSYGIPEPGNEGTRWICRESAPLSDSPGEAAPQGQRQVRSPTFGRSAW